MNGSYNAYRKHRKSPQTRLLLAIFLLTLVGVVANQVFVDIQARQERLLATLVSDLRVAALELAMQATALTSGNGAAVDGLEQALGEFETAWSRLNAGGEPLLDTGLGLHATLPGQRQTISAQFPDIPQTWDGIRVYAQRILDNREALLQLTPGESLDADTGAPPAEVPDTATSAALAASAIVTGGILLESEFTLLDTYFSTMPDLWFESPFLGYTLLFVLLLTLGLYARQVIRQSREAEHFAAEKNMSNNHAVLKLIGEISGLADGDLTVEATVGQDFTGPIADSINYAVGQLRGLVSAITDVTLEVTSSTDASRQMVEALSEASRRQSQSINSVYASIREIGNGINLVSENSQRSLHVAGNSVQTAAGGAEVVKDTIKGMDTIRNQIQDTAKRIKRLGESSQAIGGFVSLINDIAAHTNTLSLNAAIQAASAGDAGKGFAVVADEVHALAERSSDATRQIESLVKIIQRDITEAVQSMEQTTAEVVAGTGLARRAGTALDDIQMVSKELAELVSSITNASRSQSKAATELRNSMEVIQKVTSDTSGGIEETRTFITRLGGLTERLKMTVSGFSLSKKDKWTRLKKGKVTPMAQKAADPVIEAPHTDKHGDNTSPYPPTSVMSA